jgi:hypothetical protein
MKLDRERYPEIAEVKIDRPINMRWQGLGLNAQAPSIVTRIVKLGEIEGALPLASSELGPSNVISRSLNGSISMT